MYYEINVSKLNPETGRYIHYFATSERSITDFYKCQQIIAEFKIKFPEEEGYKLTCTHWRKTGEEMAI